MWCLSLVLIPLPWCTKVVYGVRYAVSTLVNGRGRFPKGCVNFFFVLPRFDRILVLAYWARRFLSSLEDKVRRRIQYNSSSRPIQICFSADSFEFCRFLIVQVFVHQRNRKCLWNFVLEFCSNFPVFFFFWKNKKDDSMQFRGCHSLCSFWLDQVEKPDVLNTFVFWLAVKQTKRYFHTWSTFFWGTQALKAHWHMAHPTDRIVMGTSH